MAKTLLRLLVAVLLFVVLSPSAQAQVGVGFGYHPYQIASLRALAVQAAPYNQDYLTRSSCQPSRNGYYRVYRQPSHGSFFCC